MLIKEKIRRLERVDVNKALDDSIREIEDFIVELQQDQLYNKGIIDVTQPGKREHYAPSTIKAKKKKAQFKKTDYVTLRWSGELYDKIKVFIYRDFIVLNTTDLKWANYLEPDNLALGKRFGRAMGLTPESRDKLRVELRPLIIKKVRSMI